MTYKNSPKVTLRRSVCFAWDFIATSETVQSRKLANQTPPLLKHYSFITWQVGGVVAPSGPITFARDETFILHVCSHSDNASGNVYPSSAENRKKY